MPDLERAYQVLGIEPGTAPDQIIQAYRDLVKIWHPDRFSHDERLRLKAQDKLKEINGAYEVVRAALFAAGTDPGPETEQGPASSAEEPTGASAEGLGSRSAPLLALWAALGVCFVTILVLAILLLRQHRAVLGRAAPESPANASPVPNTHTNAVPGPLIADSLYTVTDDFIVDVFLNGERVPDRQRKLIADVHGATAEKISIAVREGDWLVFNVVNDRLRWDAACYFAVAGVKEEQTIGFSSEPNNPQWSSCDKLENVARFIADPDYLSGSKAQAISRPWDRGNALIRQFVKQWDGQPLWGTNRNTWIKFRAIPRPNPESLKN